MEAISLDAYRNKAAEGFTKLLSTPEEKLDPGCSAAYTAAMAAALLKRAADCASSSEENAEKLEYIRRNSEIIRNYMVHLIDENVKCRAPYRKALAESDSEKTEACLQMSCCIVSEIMNMMQHCLNLVAELKEISTDCNSVFLKESAELSKAAIKVAAIDKISLTDLSKDDTYRYVSRRESELFLAECEALFEKIAGI